jgi:hypothetical protein
MLNSRRLPFQFDAQCLQSDLAKITREEWIPHFNKGYYEGEWSAVPLRSVGGRADRIYPDPAATQPYLDTPILERCDYFRQVLGSFPCDFEAVRLLRLNAGSRVKEHRDHCLSIDDGELRIHVPVQTNPAVEFTLEGLRIVMNEGETWYVNFNLPHAVNNAGDTDRVHLVIDCVINDWWREQLAR